MWTSIIRKRWLLASILAVALAIGSSCSTYAQISGCRTDPTVTLSNGYVVTLWADVSTDISNVTRVDYVLHVPAGVTLQSVSYDSNGYLENLQVVADQTGTHYSDQTTVYTATSGIADSANATRQDSTVATKNGKTGTTVTLNWCT